LYRAGALPVVHAAAHPETPIPKGPGAWSHRHGPGCAEPVAACDAGWRCQLISDTDLEGREAPPCLRIRLQSRDAKGVEIRPVCHLAENRHAWPRRRDRGPRAVHSHRLADV